MIPVRILVTGGAGLAGSETCGFDAYPGFL